MEGPSLGHNFPGAAKNADGRLDVFGIDGAGNVINSWQERGTGGCADEN
jgi:hypothetical protein